MAKKSPSLLDTLKSLPGPIPQTIAIGPGKNAGLVTTFKIHTKMASPKNFDMSIISKALGKQQLRIDAKVFNDLYMNKLDYPEDRGRSRFQLAVLNNRQHFRADQLPAVIIGEGVDPYFANVFVWGPLGEWIGVPVDKSHGHHQQLPYRLASRYVTMNKYDGLRDLNPFDDTFKPAAFFPDYDYLARNVAGNVISLQMAAAIQLLCMPSEVIEEWATCLTRHGDRSGFGVLKDGEGHFDSIGAYLDHLGIEWFWDEKEQAWGTLEGDVFQPSHTEIRDLFQIPSWVPENRIKPSFAVLTNVSDNQSHSHGHFANNLREALQIRTRRFQDIEQALKEQFDREMDDRYIRMPKLYER